MNASSSFLVMRVLLLPLLAIGLGTTGQAFESKGEGEVTSLIALKKGSSEALGIQCIEHDPETERCSLYQFVLMDRVSKDRYSVRSESFPYRTSFTADGLTLISDRIVELSTFSGVELTPFPLTLQTYGQGGLGAQVSWLAFLTLPVDILTAPIHIPLQAGASYIEGKKEDKNGTEIRDRILEVQNRSHPEAQRKAIKLSEEQWHVVMHQIETCRTSAFWGHPQECNRH